MYKLYLYFHFIKLNVLRAKNYHLINIIEYNTYLLFQVNYVIYYCSNYYNDIIM